jgi:hypothetical protein
MQTQKPRTEESYDPEFMGWEIDGHKLSLSSSYYTHIKKWQNKMSVFLIPYKR